MEQEGLDGEMRKLLESLIDSVTRTRRVKKDDISSRLLFDIYNMNQNNMSKVLSDSAIWVTPQYAAALSEQSFVHRIATDNKEKYALTFRGIASCIKLRYGYTLEEQFLKFLNLSDQKFENVDQALFRWDEKLAGLSLILVASTSDSSAIRLNNETNKVVFTEVFDRVLASLKKFGLIDRNEKLRNVKRGESPVMAVMSRLNTLARKTNHYYKSIPQESAYFFDIETSGTTDEGKLSFLFSRLFQGSPETNFDEMYKEFVDISHLYSPRFLGRSPNPSSELVILRKLKDFFDTEVHGLALSVPRGSAS